MFAFVLFAVLQQDVVADVPVYEVRPPGISLPRPFDDWVFVASSERGTTTVFFHPRAGSLSDGLWGALVITSLDVPQTAAAIADRRLETAWRPQLGASYTLLARDSFRLDGEPAVRILVGGSIARAVLEIEEFVVVRGRELVMIQFRYPRGVPRDSLAAGYRRTLEGLSFSGAAPPAPAAPESGAEAARRWQALRQSPWTMADMDAEVRFDTRAGPRAAAVRLGVVNDGTVSTGVVTFWLPALARLDSVRAGARRVVAAGTGQQRRVSLSEAQQSAERAELTTWYRWTGEAEWWMPLVQPPTDSAGTPRRGGGGRVTLRFDVPDSLAVVATGRLVAEVAAAGRRRQTWSSDDAWAPVFLPAAPAPATLRRGRLAIVLWRRGDSPLADSIVAARIADNVAGAWATLWRAFGPLDRTEVHLVATEDAATRGHAGIIALGADLFEPGVIARELARTWWGGAIRLAGEDAAAVQEAVVSWSGDRIAGRAAPHSLDAVAAAITLPRLREALRSLAAEARDGWLTAADFYAAIGPQGAAAFRATLR